ncbi:MAG: hypothetical protein ACTSQE_14195 [Candidatus Heimdallarchaeaceae archaeon]
MKNDYGTKIDELLKNFFEKGDEKPIINFLMQNSRTSDDQLNLDLVRTFLRVIEKQSGKNMKKTWKLALKLAQFPFEKAPSTNSAEFVVFIGTWTIGLLAGLNPAYIELATPVIQSLLNDPKTAQIVNGVKQNLSQVIAKGEEEANKLLLTSKNALEKLDLSKTLETSKSKVKNILEKVKKETKDKKKPKKSKKQLLNFKKD